MAEREGRFLALCRAILAFRLISLTLTGFAFLGGAARVPALLVCLLIALPASMAALRFPERLIPLLSRHPALLGADIALALVILLLTGVSGPFFLYTLGSALLAGVVYGRTGVLAFTALLLAGYYGSYLIQLGDEFIQPSFQNTFGQPALYVFAALGGAAVRRLLDREADNAGALATEQVRLRVAREMHDSLGKTLQGVSLSASAVSRLVADNPERAGVRAAELAEAARTAADEARELIRDLRADRLSEPLDVAVARYAGEWSDEAGVAVEPDLAPVPIRSPEARYEVFSLLREALENVRRHAEARSVRIELRERGGEVSLVIADDGVGIDPERPAAAAGEGHYGLVGMAERARRLGGSMELAAPPAGARLEFRFPPDPEVLDLSA